MKSPPFSDASTAKTNAAPLQNGTRNGAVKAAVSDFGVGAVCRTCANPECAKEFEATHWRKYCCVKCRNRVARTKPKAIKEGLRQTAKRYVAGKLPPWMFS